MNVKRAVIIKDGINIMGTMKAIQISKPGGDFELVQRGIPKPAENEVLIKVEACGVCHGGHCNVFIEAFCQVGATPHCYPPHL